MADKQYPSNPNVNGNDLAPAFAAQAVDGNTIRELNLNEYNGKWLILFFYPSDFTPV
jgi:alkyl hydroperoxide reductase subunit AhpC